MLMTNLGEPVAKGNTAAIYLHGGKIVKIFNDGLPDTQAEYEAGKQRYAFDCGLPVPLVYEVTKVNGRPAIVMEHIEGRTIGELILGDMSKLEQYMRLSVDIQRRIQAVKAPGMALMADKLRREIASARLLRDGQKDALAKKLRAMKCGGHLCHGDCHVLNLILKEGHVTILDWVDASAGDIRADACRTWLLYTEVSADLADLYLRLYCDQSGIPRDEILQWAPIVAGARLSENISSEIARRLAEIVDQGCPRV
jgi:aminoglycoside phosphotransferase (APT) family kinase protein